MGWYDNTRHEGKPPLDADLLRWYFDERSSPSGTPAEAASTDFGDEVELGVEAAQPALQMHLMRELMALQQR